jgi:uncharacterized protein (DUF3084 family)
VFVDAGLRVGGDEHPPRVQELRDASGSITRESLGSEICGQASISLVRSGRQRGVSQPIHRPTGKRRRPDTRAIQQGRSDAALSVDALLAYRTVWRNPVPLATT